MQIRNYQPQDFDQLIALYKDSSTYGGNFDAKRDTAEKLQATTEAGNLLVAIDDNQELVGSVMILDNPHSFWLLRFVVNNNSSHKDEAAKLLSDKALEIAKSRNHSSVIVYTDSDNQNLAKRYSELGFKKSSSYQCYWKVV